MRVELYRGAAAYSRFRLAKLYELLNHHFSDLERLEASFIHFANFEGDFDSQIDEKLTKLLQFGDRGVEIEPTIKFWSVPRLDTISPWSSKATEIARHCAIDSLSRLERGIEWQLKFKNRTRITESDKKVLTQVLTDRMTESVLFCESEYQQIFNDSIPRKLQFINVLKDGIEALEKANVTMGLALSFDEMNYLCESAIKAKRNLTDVELMMFSQVNSEHCRHKIFNASWSIDQQDQDRSLFAMIKNTHQLNPSGTLTAYADNSAVIEGSSASRFFPDTSSKIYSYHAEPVHILVKVETHNHPTAISPFPGAATGSGGEIRDEGATGRGGKPKAGVTGFSVSNLRLPDSIQPWEGSENKPAHIASPLSIMLDGPIGGASFNNEFGRPNIAGYFRTFEQQSAQTESIKFGYHKPIMIAGGMGNIREQHVQKNGILDKDIIIVLGGPAMLIGLGGGAASSVASGQSDEQLDFASVQRANPEMQRRCQEVIDSCWAMGEVNPIVSIHDVGAGGLSNAVPELVHDSGLGGNFELRNVLNDELSMSPMEIWCNESQERYVIAVKPANLDVFEKICQRERCLYCIVGEATALNKLTVTDNLSASELADPIDIDMNVLFGDPPKMHRQVKQVAAKTCELEFANIDVAQAIDRLLSLPTIADKTFLITIGDRSVTGMISRDQMVGPWQVPVADVAVTTSSFDSYCGEAMAMGERTPLAVIDPAASGRIAVGEVITNIAAANIEHISHIKLSANWMAAAGFEGQDAALYETVQAVGMDLCPKLGISIPVGKDSMSMRTVWQQEQEEFTVASPVSLIVTGFSPVKDVRKTLTPLLDLSTDSILLLIDLGENKNRLGGSCLAQVYNETGGSTPDVNRAKLLADFFDFIQTLNLQGLALAYHDRSDGGMLVTLLEMAFASRCGLEINLQIEDVDAKSLLFNEELGAVVQVHSANVSQVEQLLKAHNLGHCSHFIGHPVSANEIKINHLGIEIFNSDRISLHRKWSYTTWKMQSLRDNPDCADQEYNRLFDESDLGLYSQLTFNPKENVCAPYLNLGMRPKVAILREQGVNSQTEMAAAFDRAGFTSVDVHMSDLAESRLSLSSFSGFVACGGFSFGDVLGAGQGWAKSILYNASLRDQFELFFQQTDKFSLGVCNGCQMMSALKILIPGADDWPRFVRNKSEQYEARQVMVKIKKNPSIFFNHMEGSEFPVVVAHGEGQTSFQSSSALGRVLDNELVAARFVNNNGQVSDQYPYNPNGSINGITALTSLDGRATILMPHPERVFRSVTNSWRSADWGEDSPWMRIFRNARCWVD